MSQSRALLLIADIGGYTSYMRLHRLSLAHAQLNIERLLEAVIDAAPGLELVEIEGDAAFFSDADSADSVRAAGAAMQAATTMHDAFHAELRELVGSTFCPCDACVQAGNLRLKCVAHVGEVTAQTIRDRKSLVGVDVIIVHRLLKNSVPVPEYVLLSEELYRGGEAAVAGRAMPIEQELEGLGPTRAYFVELGDGAEEGTAQQPVALPRRAIATIGIIGRGLPYMVGLKRPRSAGD